MKKLTAALLALVMALTLCATAWAEGPAVDISWCTGDVTTYTISTDAQLRGLAKLVNESGYTFEGKTIQLGMDIDLNNVEWTPIGNAQDKPFKGTFDGKNHTISNLKISTSAAYAGLFGYVTASKTTSATIKDLKLQNVSITSNGNAPYVGALAGAVGYTFIDKVSASNVSITATGLTALAEIGGLIGECSCVIVSNSGVDTALITYSGSGSGYVGGLTSYVNGHSSFWTADTKNSKFTNCYTTNVTISSNQSAGSTAYTVRVGGFAVGCTGYNGSHNTYEGCNVTNLTISCAGEGKQIVGGFMAFNKGLGSDSNCTASGSITSTNTNENSEFGGFIGHQGGRGRTHSNHTVNVDINVANGYAGGFIGKTEQYLVDSGTTKHYNNYKFENCIANGNVTNANGVAGGFAGENGCYGGDGHQIWVTYEKCVANGNISGKVAAGFLGRIANNNGSITNSSIIGITLTNCSANGIVSGSDAAAGLVGSAANKNTTNGNSTPITVDAETKAAPIVVGTANDTTVSKDIIVDTTKSDGNKITNDAKQSKTTIKGSGITIDDKSNAITVPAGTEVNGTQITETERIDGTSGKVIPTMTLSANAGSIKTGKTVTFTYTFTGDGTVTAESSDSGVATVTVDAENKTVTITGVSAGTAIITVSGKETANYDSATAEYTVEVTQTRRYTVKPNATPTEPVESPKTFDAGVAVYGVMALTSVMGMGYIGKKKF